MTPEENTNYNKCWCSEMKNHPVELETFFPRSTTTEGAVIYIWH